REFRRRRETGAGAGSAARVPDVKAGRRSQTHSWRRQKPMNARRNRSIVVTMIVGMCAVWAAPARAQSNDEVFPSFQFNFSTPGARANALGRAFIGLADDASASI